MLTLLFRLNLDTGAVVLLPDNIIRATQLYTDVVRRIGYTEPERAITVTHARRTVTFDG